MDVSESTSQKSENFQARGGYGGGGYGGGGHGGGYGGGDYGHYVDPYVVLASLGFGVFLFNLIYNLLNKSARSIDVSDMNLPLQLSDRPEYFMNFLENVTSSQDFEWNKPWTAEMPASKQKLFTKSMQIGRRITDAVAHDPVTCSKALLCHLAHDDVAWNRQPTVLLKGVQLYIASLAYHFGQEDVAKYIDQVEARIDSGNTEIIAKCDEFKRNSICNESELMSLF